MILQVVLLLLVPVPLLLVPLLLVLLALVVLLCPPNPSLQFVRTAGWSADFAISVGGNSVEYCMHRSVGSVAGPL
jgi:hypothetical protein